MRWGGDIGGGGEETEKEIEEEVEEIEVGR